MRVKSLLFVLFLSIFCFSLANATTSVKHKKSTTSKHNKTNVVGQKIAKPKNKIKSTKIKHNSNNIKTKHAKKRDYMNGVASYYGGGRDGFDGKQMANGGYFDSSAFTAAHPTVPLGTKLKVINLANNRSVYVEVTDRMPKKTGRVIDLSYGVGKYLGLLKRGIVNVKLEKVTDAEYATNKDTLLVASNDRGLL